MKDQHTKIKGYRDLSQEEIDLMNRIKTKGAELLELQAELGSRLSTDAEFKASNAAREKDGDTFQEGATVEFERFKAAEPQRWAAIGKTDIQTGLMALIRAVAQPSV
ncbi:MAG: hypothetical protein KGI50_08010 [Patescibacteria group bacterium]|nr:hypothetical protein [Patescibacteria group bacterium]